MSSGDADYNSNDESVCPLPLERKYVSKAVTEVEETIKDIGGTGCATPCWPPLPHTDESWLSFRTAELICVFSSFVCACLAFYYQYSKKAGYENLIPSFVGAYIYLVSVDDVTHLTLCMCCACSA